MSKSVASTTCCQLEWSVVMNAKHTFVELFLRVFTMTYQFNLRPFLFACIVATSAGGCKTSAIVAGDDDSPPENQTIIEIRTPTVLYSVNGNTKLRSKGSGKSVLKVASGHLTLHLGVLNQFSDVSYRFECGVIEVDLKPTTHYAVIALANSNSTPPTSSKCTISVLELIYDAAKGKNVPSGTVVPHKLVPPNS